MSQSVRQRVHQFQEFLDETMAGLADHEVSDIERELAMIDLNELVSQEKERLNELDTSVGKTVRVSGEIHRAYHDDLTDEDCIETVSVQNEEMESAGFTVYPLAGESDEVRQTVGYLFRNDAPLQAHKLNSLTPRLTHYYSFAEYDSVRVERPRTANQARARLESTAPEAMSDLETTLLNIESPIQALTALAELTYPDGHLDEDTKACLALYANQLIQPENLPLIRLDMKEKYMRSVGGLMILQLSFKEQASVAATVSEVSLYTSDDDESKTSHWAVRADIQATDNDNSNLVGCPDFSVPAKNIMRASQLNLDS